jgi:hypothetical protein
MITKQKRKVKYSHMILSFHQIRCGIVQESGGVCPIKEGVYASLQPGISAGARIMQVRLRLCGRMIGGKSRMRDALVTLACKSSISPVDRTSHGGMRRKE